MYNIKQYDAARDFVNKSMSKHINNVDNVMDALRLKTYDLYEDIYLNSTFQLNIVLRGEDQTPILIPTGKKLVETTNRFLGVNLDYLVEGQGDAGIQQLLDLYFKDFFKREKIKSKFESGKRWGLTRGDSIWYVYADVNKDPTERISIAEIDPRQVFEIEDIQGITCGYHLVDLVRDWRDPDQKHKLVVRRRTFRKAVDDDGCVIKSAQVTSELGYFELNAWDDRDEFIELEPIPGGAGAHDPIELGFDEAPITRFPLYIWNNAPMQNTHWGTSQLAGLESLMYAINQSITDEDCTIVFQGLGMYVTTAGRPIDPNTGAYCDWNIGPMQIIEIGETQKFERVSGVNDMKPFQDHMTYMDEKGLSESSGIPEVAIGRVDVQSAESGISLKLQFMPLLAQNAEKELLLINLWDQLFHDLVTQWLPAYEWENFGNFEAMQECSVVSLFDDPMPVDRSALIDEVVLLESSNLILTTMAIAKLRSVGWQYPTVDQDGNEITDEDIVNMLLDQAQNNAIATGAAIGPDQAAFDSATGTPPPPANVGNTPPAKQSRPITSS